MGNAPSEEEREKERDKAGIACLRECAPKLITAFQANLNRLGKMSPSRRQLETTQLIVGVFHKYRREIYVVAKTSENVLWALDVLKLLVMASSTLKALDDFRESPLYKEGVADQHRDKEQAAASNAKWHEYERTRICSRVLTKHQTGVV